MADELTSIGAAAFDCLVEKFSQVAAEISSLRKAARIAAFGGKSLGKMIRLASDGAHALGPDIEKVDRFRRGISDPATSSSAAVYQGRFNASTC